jgi:thymidylate synthase ThyX
MKQVEMTRYTDPERLHLAKAAAIYLGKEDVDNIKRPLSIMKKRHALAIFRGESARFEFKTSKVVYDHLITYTTADMRACAGLRANQGTTFIPPVEDNDPVYQQIADESIANYQALICGVDPTSEDPIKRKRLQAARSILPMSTELHYMFQFNFQTLITIFQQRIWTPGAQQDTAEVVQQMFALVRMEDPELWNTVYDMFGPEEMAWVHARNRVKKEMPDLYASLVAKYGNIKTMW